MTIDSNGHTVFIEDERLAGAVLEVKFDAGISPKVRGLKIAAAIEHAMQQYQRDHDCGLPMPGAPKKEE